MSRIQENKDVPCCWLPCVLLPLLLLLKFKTSYRFLLPHISLYLLPNLSLLPSLSVAALHGGIMNIVMITGRGSSGDTGRQAATLNPISRRDVQMRRLRSKGTHAVGAPAPWRGGEEP